MTYRNILHLSYGKVKNEATANGIKCLRLQ